MSPLDLNLPSVYSALQHRWLSERPPAFGVLAVSALAFAVGLLFRYGVIFGVRHSGARAYTASWQRVEALTGYGALCLGAVAGLFGFGDVFAAALCAGAFWLLNAGSVLHALATNEHRSDR